MKKRILFIGNSHTYLHYMPQMLGQLVSAGNCDFELEADQSVGEGASLEWHWNSRSTRHKMRRRDWDFIVLQERSGVGAGTDDLGLTAERLYEMAEAGHCALSSAQGRS